MIVFKEWCCLISILQTIAKESAKWPSNLEGDEEKEADAGARRNDDEESEEDVEEDAVESDEGEREVEVVENSDSRNTGASNGAQKDSEEDDDAEDDDNGEDEDNVN